MKNIKKSVALIMLVSLMICQIVPVYAEDGNITEWYEMVEENYETVDEFDGILPYTLYIMNVQTSLKKISSSKLGLRADVYCTTAMKTIKVTFYLQKNTGSSWRDVSSGVASDSNVKWTAKQMTVSGLPSGTYRAKTVTMVMASNGYTETLTSYSGSLTI